jgi:predicted ATPase
LTTLLQHVTIKDYKSIAACSVDLGPLMFLVGPNGSGKSNFLDALRFCADCLRHSPDHAIRERGGINEVRRRSTGRPNHFVLRLTIDVQAKYRFDYLFEIGARAQGNYAIQREECLWERLGQPNDRGYFSVANALVTKTTIERPPPASSDRLYLVTVSGIPPFGELQRSLSTMGFYNLNPDRIRDLQSPGPGDLLARDGSNIASVLAQLQRNRPEQVERMTEFLRAVVPGIRSVSSRTLGPKETLEFVESSADGEKERRFHAASMSDGTLRALGVIVALFQAPPSGSDLPLIGIEEPEVALHPAAAGVLMDCLRESSRSRQVIVTSHSPDLLDRRDISPDSILSVASEDGKTLIGPVNAASLRQLRDRLRTPGDLLRIDQLAPDYTKIPNPNALQLRLF